MKANPNPIMATTRHQLRYYAYILLRRHWVLICNSTASTGELQREDYNRLLGQANNALMAIAK